MAVRHQTAKDCPRQHVRERRDQQRSFREAAECLCNDCQDSAKGNPAEKQPHEPSAATANALERLAEAIVAQADSFSAFISAPTPPAGPRATGCAPTSEYGYWVVLSPGLCSHSETT